MADKVSSDWKVKGVREIFRARRALLTFQRWKLHILNETEAHMTTFHVPDMSCGHCRKAIEKAVGAADSAATVECDLDAHLVKIDSKLPAGALAAALEGAGYKATVAA